MVYGIGFCYGHKRGAMKRLVARYTLPPGIAIAAVGANPFPNGPGYYGWMVFNPTMWTPGDHPGAAGVSLEGESPVHVAYLPKSLQLRVQDGRILGTNDQILNLDLNSWWVKVERSDRLIAFVGTRDAINELPRHAHNQINEFLHGCAKVFHVEP